MSPSHPSPHYCGARTNGGFTQESLAERAGVSWRTISDLERGMKLPRRDTMALLADALALPAAERAVFGAAARPPMHRTAVPGAPPDDPKHVAAPWVYVAHAQTDDAVVERLHTDLEQYGITVWVDEHGLPPGTPDWEQALRKAIRASMALLLLASPRTRTSRYVADELRIAELYGRRVFPIWIEGDQWMERAAIPGCMR